MPTKFGVKLNDDRKVETPAMFSRLILRTQGGYMWMQKSGTENTWISNGWMGECTFDKLLELYGPVVIVNPDDKNFRELPMITKDGYLVHSVEESK